ncbi:hypothetical protein THERMOS_1034 [Bathymodiolus thermophilus thioautotrophic gill symbiont]|uniref:Uncharacterized protein n=1 Tax=Bathymodiolus thermophilus thioautotrophic gill symbiont TaxID=2360 RepID=A0A8H9CHD6_9GAMM|nr:hypothetical protein THERMOS_1034 [Bathymodiolus thermophilus thioautotrophic gill symbiont]
MITFVGEITTLLGKHLKKALKSLSGAFESEGIIFKVTKMLLTIRNLCINMDD